MPMAFVLINADMGSENKILNELQKIDAVKEVHIVYGVYDVAAKIQGETMEQLKNIVTWKVRQLNNVRSTLTLIVIEERK
ncbi:MAG: Lrp/AsnC ligand binding domain-containing protein [Candidatus Bathyarchaeota archaeon]